MLKKSFFLTALVLASVARAVAQTPVTLPPALSEAVRSGGLKVDKSFAALSGMTGYVLNRSGEYSIVYATPDGQTLINGVLISAEGKNMSPVYADQYIPKPDYDAMWSIVEKAPVVVTGAKGTSVKAVVYAFLDPNCGFCHLAWKEFKPYEKAGLQVRWLPVAYLGPTSAAKAAAILQSEDPTAMLNKHETDFKVGGIPHQGVVVKDETKAKLDSNSKLMREFGFNGTPALVYRDVKTGKVLTKNGLPRMSEIPALFGLPYIPNADPELAKFE